MSAVYPSQDIRNQAGDSEFSKIPQADFEHAAQGAPVASVVPFSPADDAGFTEGCRIVAVDGHPIRDVIDWRWYAADDQIEVSYIDTEGDAGTVVLERDIGEEWGFEFEGLLFDDVKLCRNACTFCFMHQLPNGMRPSLSMRDDDFRLSFLVGTFVTLTNLSEADEQRIIEQRISPLRVSLQASDDDVRRTLIGKHAKHGKEALDRLLAAGIEFHAQIVLVPDGNDGEALRHTLEWAYERPGILNVGIVPLGYTRFQNRFTRSFNEPAQSQAVLDIVEPFQRRALDQRGNAWVFAADEFYSNAYGAQLVEKLPDTSFYDDFSLFEDGIGIIRSTIDEWREAKRMGLADQLVEALRAARACAVMIAGFAQRNFLDVLVEQAGLSDVFEPLYVKNDYFGGNVDVTGLLVGDDIAHALAADARAHESDARRRIYLVPRVVFNDDMVLLDDMRAADVERAAGVHFSVVSLSPLDYFEEIIGLV